jgi:ATP-dependent phosphoenolpyruvate carboxykinase
VAKTENARVSYPLDFIANHEPTSTGGHPEHIIFLTCDAFGVLPAVSRLTVEQALYHFLSGYTAKVAGTERGITEPQATFSAGFGAAFLTLHPTKYADLLKQKLTEHPSKIYLVNTGWVGGAYGVGRRMSIRNTRACIDAILDDSIEQAEFVTDPVFGFEIPTTLGNVPSTVLRPRDAWTEKVSFIYVFLGVNLI